MNDLFDLKPKPKVGALQASIIVLLQSAEGMLKVEATRWESSPETQTYMANMQAQGLIYAMLAAVLSEENGYRKAVVALMGSASIKSLMAAFRTRQKNLPSAKQEMMTLRKRFKALITEALSKLSRILQGEDDQALGFAELAGDHEFVVFLGRAQEELQNVPDDEVD